MSFKQCNMGWIFIGCGGVGEIMYFSYSQENHCPILITCVTTMLFRISVLPLALWYNFLPEYMNCEGVTAIWSTNSVISGIVRWHKETFNFDFLWRPIYSIPLSFVWLLVFFSKMELIWLQNKAIISLTKKKLRLWLSLVSWTNVNAINACSYRLAWFSV